MSEAGQERARIVAWLRDDAASTRSDLRRLHENRKLSLSQTAEWEAMIATKVGIADAIERNQHGGGDVKTEA